jgi:hypothetical protein
VGLEELREIRPPAEETNTKGGAGNNHD